MTKTNTEFKAYVTNLHAYNCGYLRGEWVSFPASDEELENVLERIGCADGTEYFITDYDCELDINMGEYVSLDKINEIAEEIAGLDEWDVEKLAAALELGHYNTVSETIENLDDYILYSNVTNDRELGEEYAEDFELYKKWVAWLIILTLKATAGIADLVKAVYSPNTAIYSAADYPRRPGAAQLPEILLILEV